MIPSATAIDNLEYTYDSGNRLLKVKDNTGNPSGFKEGVYTGDAFIYDNYGNLIEDKNKGITSITYNHLNLPKKIEFGGDKDIKYLYNALGQKLQKRVRTSSTTTHTDYQSGFHYENYGLRFFATAEGYVNVILVPDITPYRFAFNNPIYWSDPTGLMEGGVGNLALGADINGVKTTFFGDLGKKKGKNKEKDKVNISSTGIPDATNDSPVYIYHDPNPESVPLPEVSLEFMRDTKAFQNFVYANSPFHSYMFQGSGFDQFNWFIGLGAKGLQNTQGSFRVTTKKRGFSPKYYDNAWRGNQYAKTFNIGNIGGGLGQLTFVYGTIKDGYGVFQYYNNPSSSSAVHPGKAGLNLGMGALGFTGWGTPASLFYGALEAFHPQGAAGALKDYNQVQSDYRKLNNGAVFKPGL